MTYSSKFNQFMGNVVGNEQFNTPMSYHGDRTLHGIDHRQHNNNFLYDAAALNGGMGLSGMTGAAISPYHVAGYMYPHQQYNLKVGGVNQEQATEYGPPHYNSGGNSGSGYGVPRFQGAKNKIKGTALSALTLLAFLYFLNLLQTCLRDQMNTMNPTVLVMTAGSREGLTKIDRVGTIDNEAAAESEIENVEGKTKSQTESSKKEMQWNLLESQTAITPKLQNFFLESQSWG